MDDVVQPRKLDELKGDPSPDTTRKKFLTIDEPGVTPRTEVPDDFSVQSVFPTMRPRSKADLAAMTKDYYLFTHCVWFSWGGMQCDPLVEFYMKDGLTNKCVSLVPLKEQMLFGVARNTAELTLERGIFAIPRERMRDVLWWLDGTAVCEGGKPKWFSSRQHLAINPLNPDFGDEYLAFYGCRSKTEALLWFHYKNGFAVGKKTIPLEKDPKTAPS